MWSSKAQRQGMIAILCVSLMGCSPFSEAGVKPVDAAIDILTIAVIKEVPMANAQAKIVQLKGRVSKHAPLLGRSAYELQDTTGSIWVLSTGATPKIGDEVVIKGKLLYQSIPLNGKELGDSYIEQQ